MKKMFFFFESFVLHHFLRKEELRKEEFFFPVSPKIQNFRLEMPKWNGKKKFYVVFINLSGG